MVSAKELLAKRKPAVIGIALALVLISWLCWYFSARQVIKRQLVGLSWEVSKKNSQESTMETALKMREVKAALADDCRVTVPEKRADETLAKDMAVMYLMYYRDRYQMLAVTFEEMVIKFPAKGEAAVQANVLLKRQKQQAAPVEISAPVTLALKKQRGDWLLTQADIAAALMDD